MRGKVWLCEYGNAPWAINVILLTLRLDVTYAHFFCHLPWDVLRAANNVIHLADKDIKYVSFQRRVSWSSDRAFNGYISSRLELTATSLNTIIL